MKIFKCENVPARVQRVSRWITVKTNYNPHKNNSLYDFAVDGNGNYSQSHNFDPETGVYLDFFRFHGRTYALNQFIRLGSVWASGVPYVFTDTNGETTTICAYDAANYYTPLYLEMSDNGEKIRLYERL